MIIKTVEHEGVVDLLGTVCQRFDKKRLEKLEIRGRIKTS